MWQWMLEHTWRLPTFKAQQDQLWGVSPHSACLKAGLTEPREVWVSDAWIQSVRGEENGWHRGQIVVPVHVHLLQHEQSLYIQCYWGDFSLCNFTAVKASCYSGEEKKKRQKNIKYQSWTKQQLEEGYDWIYWTQGCRLAWYKKHGPMLL